MTTTDQPAAQEAFEPHGTYGPFVCLICGASHHGHSRACPNLERLGGRWWTDPETRP
jgi:hypothetical protein